MRTSKAAAAALIAFAAMTAGTITIGMNNRSTSAETVEISAETVADLGCECSLKQLNLEKGETPENGLFYTVNGAYLEHCYQEYLYTELDRYGIAWMYETVLCEIYQESRFDTSAVSADGMDYGLCQFRAIYWDEHSSAAGMGGESLMNPYAQISTMAYLTAEHLRQTEYDVEAAVKLYYNSGNAELDEQYWQDVSQWFCTLEEL